MGAGHSPSMMIVHTGMVGLNLTEILLRLETEFRHDIHFPERRLRR